jgi:hypothetical protein
VKSIVTTINYKFEGRVLGESNSQGFLGTRNERC